MNIYSYSASTVFLNTVLYSDLEKLYWHRYWFIAHGFICIILYSCLSSTLLECVIKIQILYKFISRVGGVSSKTPLHGPFLNHFVE